MTVPLDMRNDIRSMDADGVPHAEIARRLHVSRNTVAKYADMEDMSPVPPLPAERGRPALEGHAEWICSVLEADLGAPRKQRHTAKRVFDRLVAERGYEGSYSTVRRFVADWRRSRAPGGGEGYLELEWAPGACQVDFGNFRAVVAGEALDLKLLVLTLPHSNERQCVALRSETSECLCAGLAEVFGRWGRAPRVVVLGNATEAGRRLRGTVVESRLFSQFRGHYRFEARFCNLYSGNEKGSVENAVGFLRRNLLVPVPAVGSTAELNAALADGCARLRASSSCRDGRPTAEALREDLAGMLALPGVAFDAVRWVREGGQARLREGRRARVRGGPALARQGAPGGRAALRRRGPRRPRPQGRGAAARLRGGAGRARPHVPPARARGQAEGLRRVDHQARHARGARGGHRPDGRRGPKADPRGDRRGRRRLRVRGRLPAWRRRASSRAGRARSLTTAVLEEWSGLGTPRQVEYPTGYLEAAPRAWRPRRPSTGTTGSPSPGPRASGARTWPRWASSSAERTSC